MIMAAISPDELLNQFNNYRVPSVEKWLDLKK